MNGGTSGQIKDGQGNIIGHDVKCRIVKNKVATPYREAVFSLYYGVGIDREGEIIDIALAADIIKQTGAWFTYKETNEDGYFKLQGKDKVKEYLKEHNELFKEIEEKIIEGFYKEVEK